MSQKEILNELKVDKKELLKLNYIIQNSEEFQNLIIKNSPARKYWNTIIPFAALTDKVLKNEFSFPKELQFFLVYLVCFIVVFVAEIKVQSIPHQY